MKIWHISAFALGQQNLKSFVSLLLALFGNYMLTKISLNFGGQNMQIAN